jgi:biopolymer transport protein ExbD
MSVNIKKSSSTAKLNLTPMIDVVFQLLIFFFVAASYEESEKKENEMPTVLPQASEAMARIAKPREIIFNVDAGGRITLFGEVMNHDQVLTALQQAEADNPGRSSVIVRGHKSCPLEHIVAVMNLCTKAEIKDYRIATAPPNP